MKMKINMLMKEKKRHLTMPLFQTTCEVLATKATMAEAKDPPFLEEHVVIVTSTRSMHRLLDCVRL